MSEADFITIYIVNVFDSKTNKKKLLTRVSTINTLLIYV